MSNMGNNISPPSQQVTYNIFNNMILYCCYSSLYWLMVDESYDDGADMKNKR